MNSRCSWKSTVPFGRRSAQGLQMWKLVVPCRLDEEGALVHIPFPREPLMHVLATRDPSHHLRVVVVRKRHRGTGRKEAQGLQDCNARGKEGRGEEKTKKTATPGS